MSGASYVRSSLLFRPVTHTLNRHHITFLSERGKLSGGDIRLGAYVWRGL